MKIFNFLKAHHTFKATRGGLQGSCKYGTATLRPSWAVKMKCRNRVKVSQCCLSRVTQNLTERPTPLGGLNTLVRVHCGSTVSARSAAYTLWYLKNRQWNYMYMCTSPISPSDHRVLIYPTLYMLTLKTSKQTKRQQMESVRSRTDGHYQMHLSPCFARLHGR